MSALYIYYWILLIFLAPALFNPGKYKSIELIYVVVNPVIYISCVFILRDFSNSNDFQNYLYIYSEVDTFEKLFSRNGEFVFNLFLIIGNTVGAPYETVYTILLLSSIIGFFLILYYSKIEFFDKLVVILFLVSSSGTYFLLANAFRQGLALILLLSALVAGNTTVRMLSLSLAPLLHFSSLVPLLSITIRKILSNKYVLSSILFFSLLLIPIIQELVFYRLYKYSDEYEYKSAFQFYRLIIDFVALLIIFFNRHKFSHIASPILYLGVKIGCYYLSPLIYSRISYYDIIIYVFLYLRCRVRNERLVKVLVVLTSILYANIIFSIESLNSNFLLINLLD